MPSYVITEKCDGCKAQDKTACQYICPNDLMTLNRDLMKAFNQETEQCWECYNCVKICPQQAIEVRAYQDFAPLGANVIPMRSTDSIMWTVKFRNGIIKQDEVMTAEGFGPNVRGCRPRRTENAPSCSTSCSGWAPP